MTAPAILVIRLGALGDFVQSFGPFAAIRAHHPGARIVLLTTPPFADLARRSPWFDEVWSEGRPAWHDPRAVLGLRRRLRQARFGRVYDLQTSGRSSRYRWLVGLGVEWSGVARGASHPHANPDRDSLHTIERQREQLEAAGITRFPVPDLGWLDGDLTAFDLPRRFALLVPGASPQRPGKKWPEGRFAAFAAESPVPCLVLGGKAEVEMAERIVAAAPGTRNLAGRTGFAEIAALARRASFALGNDTGPTHLVAAAGCPTLALFGAESDPALCAPRGPSVAVLRHVPLAGLGLEAVRAALAGILPLELN
ncbi:glycosyltransferase family 9 protein [Falsiroseomonas tokyonensis]|uniref:Glycosyltransferase family 9 protein n=1 Tax=Falsiroseomonas tokyonensis TaxID=430521 RepID=A0ABV7BPD4_9PROT|nr:glycosyltransferase family 9 protein [Falsiroseomonas tokyonensis]MBU8537478.1 glycosyltransferase family 9 protein [Falsiroseomonas tokyonensis]